MSNVEHPPHYNTGKIEVWDAIVDWQLDFLLGNVVKYVARAGHKGPEIEDLKKAREYLNKKIALLEGEPETVLDAVFEEVQEPRDNVKFVGPFVGKRVESPLEEKHGRVVLDDGDVVKVQWIGEMEPVEFSLKMFKDGIKQKWLLWIAEDCDATYVIAAEKEKKDAEQKEE